MFQGDGDVFGLKTMRSNECLDRNPHGGMIRRFDGSPPEKTQKRPDRVDKSRHAVNSFSMLSPKVGFQNLFVSPQHPWQKSPKKGHHVPCFWLWLDRNPCALQVPGRSLAVMSPFPASRRTWVWPNCQGTRRSRIGCPSDAGFVKQRNITQKHWTNSPEFSWIELTVKVFLTFNLMICCIWW